MNTTLTPPTDPDTFWASVDARFLEKVDRVFDASPKTVWIELLQNARRAGADKVSVSFTKVDEHHVGVLFEDNGSGCDSPEILLRLAARGWSQNVEHEEDPAGMGFFCLSNFPTVEVASRLWSTTLTPTIFRGAEPARRQINTDFAQGMVVNWVWEGVDVSTLDIKLREAAEFCGLKEVDIYAEGVKQIAIVPGDFMAGCTMFRDIPELGVRIGAREPDARERYLYDFGHPRIKLNFRGVVLEWVSNAMGDYLPNIARSHVQLHVEVAHTRELQLVLPARNAVKHNAARAALLEACEKLVYEWINDHATPTKGRGTVGHKLPFSIYRRALDKFGVDLGEAEFDLSQVSYHSSSTTGLKLLAHPDAQRWQDFETVLGLYNREHVGKESFLIPFTPNNDMQGYSWYDELPKLTDIILRVDGREMRLEELAECQFDKHEDKQFHEFVEDIEVEFAVDNGESYKFKPAAVVAGESTVNYFDALDRDVHIFLSRTILTDPKVMYATMDRLSGCLFEPSGDSEDSSEAQSEEFDKDLAAWILRLCDRRKEALLHILEQEARNIGYDVRDASLSWTIRYDGRFHEEEDFPGMQVISFQYSKEEADNHKFLCAEPRGTDSWIEEVVSETEITHARIEAYLRIQREFDDDDGWILDSPRKPVDLDKWEKENQEKLAAYESEREDDADV
jgi:hypothetical protein